MTTFKEELTREGTLDLDHSYFCTIPNCLEDASEDFKGEALCSRHWDLAYYESLDREGTVEIKKLGFERFNIMNKILSGEFTNVPSKKLKYG